MVALANVGGAGAFLYLVITRGAKIASFVLDAQRQSLKAARRRKSYRLARVAFDCAESPSFFIAIIIKQILFASIIMAAILSMMIVNFSPTYGAENNAQLLSNMSKLTITFSAVMFATTLGQAFTFFTGLSGAVLAINERKRLARLNVPASRRRVRVISI